MSENHPLVSMSFRRATPEDAAQVFKLIMSFQSEFTVEPTGAGAEAFLASVSVEAERSYILSDRYEYLMAEEDGTLVGFIAMRDRTHVFHLFVAAEHQRRGIARALWEIARGDAEARGHAAEFTVNSSRNAVPVYERFGFERTAEPVQEHGVWYVPMRCQCGSRVA